MIAKNVPHYPPAEEAKQRHEAVRHNVEEFARMMVELLPESPERDQVVWLMTNDVMFYANAAIARNHDALEPKPCVRPDCPPVEEETLGVDPLTEAPIETSTTYNVDMGDGTTPEDQPIVTTSEPGGVRCRCPGGLCSHRS